MEGNNWMHLGNAFHLKCVGTYSLLISGPEVYVFLQTAANIYSIIAVSYRMISDIDQFAIYLR